MIALACGTQLMVILDGLVMNLAIPRIRHDLEMTASTLQWVVTGYLVTFGALLIPAARAADLLGHRRIFLTGITVFTLAGLAGGLADEPTTLIAARLLQGAGAAALAPAGLSLLTTHTGAYRTRALSMWSATSSAAGALGLVLGGVITEFMGWRWVLLMNVPIGVALALLTTITLEAEPLRTTRGFGLPGAVLITLGIGALTYGISRTGSHGWTSGQVVGALIGAVLLLGAFVLVERRSPQRLLPLPVLIRRDTLVADTIIAGLGAIMTATMYFLSLHLQRILGMSPLHTGLALVPMSVVLTLGAFASKSLIPRFGILRLVATGGILMACGLVWLAHVIARSDDATQILGPTLIWAGGASVVLMPCVVLATRGIDAEYAGLASGLLNAARATSGAIGLAVLTTVAGTATARSSAPSELGRAAQGYSAAIVGAAIIAGFMTVVACVASASRTRTAGAR